MAVPCLVWVKLDLFNSKLRRVCGVDRAVLPVVLVAVQMEVVGMYYTASRVPGYHVCFRCYHADMRAGA